jgi:hypothetical protein
MLNFVNSDAKYILMGSDNPESETLCFLISRIPDDGQCPKNPVILSDAKVLYII